MMANKIICLVFILYSFGHICQCKLSPSEKLANLRTLMENEGYQALVIPSEDEHQSEYLANYDKRRQWITGFTGSSGIAVVTKTKAAVWTDSRYFIQAEMQLKDTEWILMKSGEQGVPSLESWLNQTLTSGQIVAQYSKFTSTSTWQSRESFLSKINLKFVSPAEDLIDKIWPADERASKPNTEIKIHDIKFAGKTLKQKIELVQARIKSESADLFVVTALDEVAWLFNLRAADIPYNPVFFAYAVINADNTNDHILYIDPSRITSSLRAHLDGIKIQPYTQVTADLEDFSKNNKRIWISPASSYAIYNSITNKNLLISNKSSPVKSIKAVKNDIEIENIRRCQIRDSAARIRHMHWLETEMSKGTLITEKTAAAKLEAIQREDSLFRMLSFNSISAVGANAAIVHYSTEEGIDSTLTKDKIYLLDAGANYEDCTSDITRTHHYGKPTAEEIYSYTKVLQGSTDLANIVFPYGVYGREIDVEARSALWRVGQDYGHGTGHGIGYFLSVHEAPPSISYNSRSQYDEPLAAGMIQSDEPGFYEKDKYGIRLETDIETVKADFKETFSGKTYLKFDSLTLVPFEKNLIDECQLTKAQVNWLNAYNNQIRDKVGPLLSGEIKDYMMKKTEPFVYYGKDEECAKAKSGAASNHFASFLIVISAVFLSFLNL